MGNELFTELEGKTESEAIGYGDPVETCPACPFCSGSDFCGRIPVGLAGRAVIPRHYATVAMDQGGDQPLTGHGSFIADLSYGGNRAGAASSSASKDVGGEMIK